jgi:putative endonuclease
MHAARSIAEQGGEILARNWRGNRGELDIVARDGSAVVGIEVKTRTSLRFGHPAEAITARKIQTMKRLLGQWLSEHRPLDFRCTEIRLDVISVLLSPRGEPTVEHLRGVS